MPCTGLWDEAVLLGLGTSPGLVMGQGEENFSCHWGDLLHEIFPVCACLGTWENIAGGSSSIPISQQLLLQKPYLSLSFMFLIFPQWPIDAEPPKHKDVGPLTFGLLFVPEFAASTLEKGPQADHTEVRGALLVLRKSKADGVLWLKTAGKVLSGPEVTFVPSLAWSMSPHRPWSSGTSGERSQSCVDSRMAASVRLWCGRPALSARSASFLSRSSGTC